DAIEPALLRDVRQREGLSEGGVLTGAGALLAVEEESQVHICLLYSPTRWGDGSTFRGRIVGLHDSRHPFRDFQFLSLRRFPLAVAGQPRLLRRYVGPAGRRRVARRRDDGLTAGAGDGAGGPDRAAPGVGYG